MIRKHKAAILLKILLKGHYIIKDNVKYLLSEDYSLCQEAVSENTSTKAKVKVLLKVNLGIELKDFINWANSFTDDEIFTTSANSVLNDIREGKNE